ncbi:cytochrome P450 [Lecanosticta acicola]|uniref:Cytochrome P450 n=1 Tax=Lecanosticta acicola TaxID=111012 RepID=A0AAI9EAJ7_9PEZI|nr:cytochrome P450 [Lecanosticta acicola]
MANKPPPILPPGNAGTLSSITDNFAFHASPEAFLTNYARRYSQEHPHQAARRRRPIRAQILNRNVVIVSAYKQIFQILESQEDGKDGPAAYVAQAPYRQLMEQFFPRPNLLLAEGCLHAEMRSSWDEHARKLQQEAVQVHITSVTSRFFSQIALDEPFDLYNALKELSWQLFLGTFLDLNVEDPEYAEIVRLQENLLRGQFSLLPVSINAGFWHSPRKIGIDARKRLQKIIARRKRPRWLGEGSMDEVAVNHLLMATSSLAVKGFASLMLALLMNTFLFRKGEETVWEWMNVDTPEKGARQQAVLRETLRLSPPIVGVMRRTTRDQTLYNAHDQEPDTLVPSGWDVWSYFAGGNRDPATFGEDAERFRPERYLDDSSSTPSPIAFGAGTKVCLGRDFTQRAAIAVLKSFAKDDSGLYGVVSAAGVRGWLGWEVASPEKWAADMKQLPTQRPSKPVMVSLRKRTAS